MAFAFYLWLKYCLNNNCLKAPQKSIKNGQNYASEKYNGHCMTVYTLNHKCRQIIMCGNVMSASKHKNFSISSIPLMIGPVLKHPPPKLP